MNSRGCVACKPQPMKTRQGSQVKAWDKNCSCKGQGERCLRRSIATGDGAFTDVLSSMDSDVHAGGDVTTVDRFAGGVKVGVVPTIGTKERRPKERFTRVSFFKVGKIPTSHRGSRFQFFAASDYLPDPVGRGGIRD